MVCRRRISVPVYSLFIILAVSLILARPFLLHPDTNAYIDRIIQNHTSSVMGALRLQQDASPTKTSAVSLETVISGPSAADKRIQNKSAVTETKGEKGGSGVERGGRKKGREEVYGEVVRTEGGERIGRVGGETKGQEEGIKRRGGKRKERGRILGEGGEVNRTINVDKMIKAVLFTTWLYDPEKAVVRGNVLRTWGTWKPKIHPHVFTDDDRVRSQAKAHGFGFQSEPKKACGGVPIYREMFRQAMKVYDSVLYGFVNGDILLGDGILSSLEAVVDMPLIRTQPVMVVVRRINVNFVGRPPIHDLHNITDIAKEGRPMSDGSSDGIFTNRLFPWDHVPDIVVGRMGIAMWMVSYAREMGVHVIDISDTAIAIHMTTKAGLKESWRHGDFRCNHKVFEKLKIKPRSWFCGFIKCAAYKTTWVTDDVNSRTRVKVEDKRSTNHKRCGECHMNMTALINTVF